MRGAECQAVTKEVTKRNKTKPNNFLCVLLWFVVMAVLYQFLEPH